MVSLPTDHVRVECGIPAYRPHWRVQQNGVWYPCLRIMLEGGVVSLPTGHIKITHGGLYNTGRESSMKADSGRKIPRHTAKPASAVHSSPDVMLNQRRYIPAPHPHPQLQTSLAESILISVVSEVASCSVTSWDVALEVSRVFSRVSSSSREPLVSFSSLQHTDLSTALPSVTLPTACANSFLSDLLQCSSEQCSYLLVGSAGEGIVLNMKMENCACVHVLMCNTSR